MKIHSAFIVILLIALGFLSYAVVDLRSRLISMENTVKGGHVVAESVVARRVAVVNPNGNNVVTIQYDTQDTSGFGDGLIVVNEGQGLDSDIERLKASVQIRAHHKLGGMVTAKTHRVFVETDDNRLKLEPIHSPSVSD